MVVAWQLYFTLRSSIRNYIPMLASKYYHPSHPLDTLKWQSKVVSSIQSVITSWIHEKYDHKQSPQWFQCVLGYAVLILKCQYILNHYRGQTYQWLNSSEPVTQCTSSNGNVFILGCSIMLWCINCRGGTDWEISMHATHVPVHLNHSDQISLHRSWSSLIRWQLLLFAEEITSNRTL
jgi:hypothetical protein